MSRPGTKRSLRDAARAAASQFCNLDLRFRLSTTFFRRVFVYCFGLDLTQSSLDCRNRRANRFAPPASRASSTLRTWNAKTAGQM
ncbi:hypothetical protein PUN28_018798 [Cardiocondyla obscurior]|uniref:Uncharacterized protein n=1 Tax=Cardiocondyla obscurior TaxID=286306 RepID=A0AAW2EG34_9HYME